MAMDIFDCSIKHHINIYIIENYNIGLLIFTDKICWVYYAFGNFVIII